MKEKPFAKSVELLSWFCRESPYRAEFRNAVHLLRAAQKVAGGEFYERQINVLNAAYREIERCNNVNAKGEK